jgi:hypothetical protein
MSRLALLLALLLLSLTSALHAQNAAVPPAGEQDPVPQAIQDMYSSYYLAIQCGELQTAQASMTQMALVQAQISGQAGGDEVLRMGEAWKLDVVEPRYLWWGQEGDRALVEYDLLIQGTERKTGDPVSQTWRRLDGLERQGQTWRIRDANVLDTERQARDTAGETLKDEDCGLETAIPADWGAYVSKGGALFVGLLQAPDLVTSIQVVAQELPLKITARDAAEIEAKQIAGPGIALERISAQETTLSGKPAYQVDAKLTLLDTTTFLRRVYCIESVGGQYIAYALAMSSDTAEAAHRYDAEFEAVRQSVKISAPGKLDTPPELGKIAGNQYSNATYQVSATIPEGWAAHLAKGQHLFELCLDPPEALGPAPEGSMRIAMLGALDLGMWVDPSQAAEANVNAQKARDPNLQVVRADKLERDGVMGYDSIIRFTAADGTPHYSRQVFFCRDTKLFFVAVEINPASLADPLQAGIDALVDSVSFQPVESD